MRFLGSGHGWAVRQHAIGSRKVGPAWRRGLKGMLPMISTLGAPLSAASGADLAYGEYLAAECVTCHRASVDQGAIPAIVGLPTRDFVNALRDYRAGRRANAVMQNVARSLDDQQIEALAAYFASLREKGSES